MEVDKSHRVFQIVIPFSFVSLEWQMKDLQLLEQRSWLHKLLKRGTLKRARRTFVSETFELWNSTSVALQLCLELEGLMITIDQV